MGRPANFAGTTKSRLERRAGHKCSFPQCDASTSGPSREGPSSTSNTGTACHIHSASTGPSARRVSNLSVAQLRHIDNGIWMCRNHGKQIDDDECTYTPELLKAWRRLAERKAELRQQLGLNVNFLTVAEAGLDPAHVVVEIADVTSTSQRLFEAFFESCLSDSWGQELTNQARELAVELCQNALTHGGASIFRAAITSVSIVLEDNGIKFGINDLTTHGNGRGGAGAARQIVNNSDQMLVATSMWEQPGNVHTLALVRWPGDVKRVTPCSIEVDWDAGASTTEKLIEFIATHPQCQRVYFLRPFGTNFSEVHLILERVLPVMRKDQDVVIVSNGSSKGLRDLVGRSDQLKLMDTTRKL